jgi:uncharacterized protein YyaL (SSP411 family)
MINSQANALIYETSPYLLQHAYNPVNWLPWGEEALQQAREKDLPILVSIGYSACHWCHVMERESFEDETVAEYMNSHFVNIKIDREERPDLDHLYMDALQALTGSGGWPLNVFLTPDGRPFYGGTYFPPQKAFNRVSWQDVLFAMNDVWTNKRAEAEAQANTLIAHIKKANGMGALQKDWVPSDSFYDEAICAAMTKVLLSTADTTDGGFGAAPKFLQTYSIQYLLQYQEAYPHPEAKEHALFSLRKMLQGGIYDQLGGGISRYSTDNQWLAPHFEKMLYDNALFLMVLTDAYQISKEEQFADAIRKTLQFICDELKDKEGGFYTALDADSEGVEGKFYTWSLAEIESILGEAAPLFCEYYKVTSVGNWEHSNILHITHDLVTFASQKDIDPLNLQQQLSASARLLLEARSKRVRPGTDDKIILSGNALLIKAFCRAYASLGDAIYLQEAEELYRFIRQHFNDVSGDFLYLHTYKSGTARYPAFLDDYAYLIQACIALQEVTGNQDYLTDAADICSYVCENFADPDSHYLFYSHQMQTDIVVRKVELYDGATPSANAVMADNLFYLGLIFENKKWQHKAVAMLQGMQKAFQKYPGSFAVWAGIYLRQTAGINEIVVTGKNIIPTLNEILCYFLPNKVLQASIKAEPFPLLEGKDFDKEVILYLCKNYTCKSPVYSADDLLRLIKKRGY